MKSKNIQNTIQIFNVVIMSALSSQIKQNIHLNISVLIALNVINVKIKLALKNVKGVCLIFLLNYSKINTLWKKVKCKIIIGI